MGGRGGRVEVARVVPIFLLLLHQLKGAAKDLLHAQPDRQPVLVDETQANCDLLGGEHCGDAVVDSLYAPRCLHQSPLHTVEVQEVLLYLHLLLPNLSPDLS